MGAVESAGGALQDADLVSINMAAKLSDGQQVYIAQKGIIRPPDKSGVLSGSSMGGSAAMALGTPRPSDRSSAAGIVDINTASPEELMALPGIGPATARHIVDYRSANGGFRSVEELYEVEGLGPSKVDRIRNLVSL